ncbi:hypothetical protein [Hymenobacter convexus]|uniref:hypothetical protein n=1 Tax=Hymenobacter sp. CA1UV-4 TaxID=3063782 RepID=UPI0027128CEA|nr:hypothetical protein [Hymenobacter sp. CA1UV-4]MDO7850065.1 hypothetical protein [Hymenobacter sp. CA1UV-4]
MMRRLPVLIALAALAAPRVGQAQASAAAKKALTDKLAGVICDCLQAKTPAEGQKPLTKESAQSIIVQCFAVSAGKDMKSIQQVYGPNAINDKQVMNNVGREVGNQMLQSCPTFITYSMVMAGNSDAASTAATTGQTTGEWNGLSGTSVASLDLLVGKTDKASFVWSRHFPKDDELLSQLDKLKGRQVRVSWEEVDVFQAETKQYHKQRQITGIELL